MTKIGIALLVLSLTTPSFGAADTAIDVNFCQLVQAASDFDRKRIRVSASIESDGLEQTVLVAKSCGGKAVALLIAEDVPKQKDIEDLLDAIYGTGSPGTKDKEITATVTGVFSNRLGQIPTRTIEAEVVENLNVTMLK